MQAGYEDVRGDWHETPAEAQAACLRAMGAKTAAPNPPGSLPAVLVVGPGEEPAVPGPGWTLTTEDGGTERMADGLPPDLPDGYHRLQDGDTGQEVRLIRVPPACFLPPALRTWGWAVQLYAARSARSWGMGDLGDLRALGEWSAQLGAGMLLLNPLHATHTGRPQEPSPYYPSSRCFRNPLYLEVEEVPGAETLGEELEDLARAGRALNRDRRVDRDEVHRLKMEALERVWRGAGAPPELDRWRAAHPLVDRFATFCALEEEHGRNWRDWPAPLRRADPAAVRQFTAANADRVSFHAWMQWLIDAQLAAAAERLDLVHDVAIGTDGAGADAWMWQDCFADEVTVGAPPDEFNAQGQDWGLPPFDPWRLAAAGYEPFVQVVRSGFRHAGGIRFDHVMGLFRLWWVPSELGPAQGAYVRYPGRDLLGILALESHRAGAWVVGEDLGTVEDRVRHALDAARVLSYRLVWFEAEPPRAFPARALAAVTTHDLPTVAGLWTGADLRAQRDLGLAPNEESLLAVRDRLARWTRLEHDAAVEDVVRRTHDLLAEAPSAVLAATLEDVLGVEERPNYPGTTAPTNWSQALPRTLEELAASTTALEVAHSLGARNASMAGTGEASG